MARHYADLIINNLIYIYIYIYRERERERERENNFGLLHVKFKELGILVVRDSSFIVFRVWFL